MRVWYNRKFRMVKTEKEYRQDIVEIGRLAYQKGWVAANDGNITIRLDQDRILATPTGVSKGMLHVDDLIIVDMQGKVVGRHDGIVRFTVGQRRGLALGGRAGTDNDPLYVVRLEPETRRVVVGPRPASPPPASLLTWRCFRKSSSDWAVCRWPSTACPAPPRSPSPCCPIFPSTTPS